MVSSGAFQRVPAGPDAAVMDGVESSAPGTLVSGKMAEAPVMPSAAWPSPVAGLSMTAPTGVAEVIESRAITVICRLSSSPISVASTCRRRNWFIWRLRRV